MIYNPKDLSVILEAIRKNGWSVAAHNDYRQVALSGTFWLFTKGTKALKGEGSSDYEALLQVFHQVNVGENRERSATMSGVDSD